MHKLFKPQKLKGGKLYSRVLGGSFSGSIWDPHQKRFSWNVLKNKKNQNKGLIFLINQTHPENEIEKKKEESFWQFGCLSKLPRNEWRVCWCGGVGRREKKRETLQDVQTNLITWLGLLLFRQLFQLEELQYSFLFVTCFFILLITP